MELTYIQKIAIWAIPLLFAITLHEVAHGWVASFFGDQTARFTGRLSLNPLKHIDPVGTIAVPLVMLMFSNFIFGWAKPVPVDARNFRHPERDMAIVALAGPLSNFCMAFIWGMLAKIGMLSSVAGNTWLGEPLLYMGGAGIMINVVIAILNLIPLPPLDGGRIFAGLLPKRAAYQFSLLEPYGFIILILLMFSGVLASVMGPFVYFFINFITSLFGLAQ
jgi:Zn-dependent protease